MNLTVILEFFCKTISSNRYEKLTRTIIMIIIIIIKSLVLYSYIILPMKNDYIQINVGLRLRNWVLWWAGDPLIANIEDLVGMLVAPISGTQTTSEETTQWSDTNEKSGIRENNKNVFHCYFKSNPTQRVSWEKMIKISAESNCLKCNKTNLLTKTLNNF